MPKFPKNTRKHEVLHLEIGNTSYYIHASDPQFIGDVLRKDGIEFDSLKPCPLNPYNGLIRCWAVGKLIEYIKEENESRRSNQE